MNTIIKKEQELIQVPNIAATMISDFMSWGGMGLTIDFNGLMLLISQLEKKGYVIVIDCEETYLHYPKSAKGKAFQRFNNSPKIQGVYRACLTAVRDYIS